MKESHYEEVYADDGRLISVTHDGSALQKSWAEDAFKREAERQRPKNEFMFIRPDGTKEIVLGSNEMEALETFIKKIGVMPYEYTDSDGQGNIVTEGYDPEFGSYRHVKPDLEARETAIQMKATIRKIEDAEAKIKRQADEIIRINEAYRRVKERQKKERQSVHIHHDGFIVSMDKDLVDLKNAEAEEKFETTRRLKIAVGSFFVTFGVVTELMGFLT